MKYYTQLTQEERFPKAEIARKLKRHPSTFTREIRLNTGRRRYRIVKQCKHSQLLLYDAGRE